MILRLMRRVPAGMLLVPMLVSSLLYTFYPDLFQIGGMTELLFTNQANGVWVALLTFASGLSMDLSTIVKVLKKQGLLLGVKLVIALVACYFYLHLFGDAGIWGISSLAFLTAMVSINPSIYLSLTEQYGTESDPHAFNLFGLFVAPATPLFVYNVSQFSGIDWQPIITTLIPMLIGLALGTLDPSLKKFMSPLIPLVMPFLGWGLGWGLNLKTALLAGPQGVLLTGMFYLFMLPILITERRVLKGDGVVGAAMLTFAGQTISFPSILAAANPRLAPLVEGAVSQLTLVLVLTSIISPMIVKHYARQR